MQKNNLLQLIIVLQKKKQDNYYYYKDIIEKTEINDYMIRNMNKID